MVISGSLVLITVVASMLVLEVGLRVFAPQNLYPVSFANDPTIGYRYKPNLNVWTKTKEYHTRLRTNSRGFRDEDHSFPKPPDTFRILTLGDSFTSGDGVELPQVFHQILETRLNNKNPTARFETISAGVSGWGLSNSLAYLINEGIHYNPDLLIVQIYVDHHYRDRSNGLFQVSGPDSVKPISTTTSRRDDSASTIRTIARMIPFYQYLAQNSHFLNLLRTTVVNILWESQQDDLHETTQAHASDPFLLSLNILNTLNTYAKQADIPWLLIAIAPWQQILGETPNTQETEFHNTIIDWAEFNQVALINTVPAIQTHADPREFFHLQDGHYNMAGHRLLAGLIYLKLQSDQLGLELDIR